jgi:AcrR family transcriptional regulator
MAEPPSEGRPALRAVRGDAGAGVRVRAVDAVLRCVAVQGLRGTTVDDIAREAGLSRATLYRTFPGGRAGVLAATLETEVARFFSALAVDLGTAEELEDGLVVGMVGAAKRLGSHPALATLFAQEPEVVLPWLTFGGLDRLLATTTTFTAPFLGRWLEPEQAARAAEWVARIVLTYVCAPSRGTDPARPADARRLVRQFVLPGIEALAGDAAGPRRPTKEEP